MLPALGEYRPPKRSSRARITSYPWRGASSSSDSRYSRSCPWAKTGLTSPRLRQCPQQRDVAGDRVGHQPDVGVPGRELPPRLAVATVEPALVGHDRSGDAPGTQVVAGPGREPQGHVARDSLDPQLGPVSY